MLRAARLIGVIALGCVSPALAQEGAPSVGFSPGGPALDAPLDLRLPVPYAPAESGLRDVQPTGHDLTLEARLVAGQDPLRQGVTWRLFAAEPGEDGQLPLVATATGGTAVVPLPPGTYLVHAAFGRAVATKRVTLGTAAHTESLVIEAGGMKLSAVVGDDFPVAPDRVTFEVSQENESGQRVVVVPKASPERVLRLKAGTYHVVSRYGSVNSVVRADIEVEPGKLTEAVIRHDGAEATLKLVSDAGGEALANTSWTVLTEAGDTVHESVGAFPRLILAAGKYTAVASHKGQVYSRDFEIESGRDRDIEVRLSDLLRPDNDFGPR